MTNSCRKLAIATLTIFFFSFILVGKLSAQDLSANSIPSKFYKVKPQYKTAYKHIKQKTNECSWTAYVMAAGAIAKGKGNSYEVSHAKVERVKDWCRNRDNCSGNYTGVCGSHISTVTAFGNSNDKSVITSKSKSRSTSLRIYMVKDMLDHIQNYGTPFLALGKRGSIGHYYIIWSIDWKQGGSGSTVWYTDPYLTDGGNFDANIKSMGLTEMLNSMRDNPDANLLNIISTY